MITDRCDVMVRKVFEIATESNLDEDDRYDFVSAAKYLREALQSEPPAKPETMGDALSLLQGYDLMGDSRDGWLSLCKRGEGEYVKRSDVVALLREIADFGDPDGQRGHATAKVREWGQKDAALLASSQKQADAHGNIKHMALDIIDCIKLAGELWDERDGKQTGTALASGKLRLAVEYVNSLAHDAALLASSQGQGDAKDIATILEALLEHRAIASKQYYDGSIDKSDKAIEALDHIAKFHPQPDGLREALEEIRDKIAGYTHPSCDCHDCQIDDIARAALAKTDREVGK